MKKIPKSITVTVRNGENFRATRPGKTWPGRGVAYEDDLFNISNFAPGTPVPPYRLTYAVDKYGPYVVYDSTESAGGGEGCICVRKRNQPEGGSDKQAVPTCFLPAPWIGLRVSRRVEKVKK